VDILGPLLYILHTSDLPTSRETTLGTFANDTAIFATHEDPTIASLNLQEHLYIIEKWLKNWIIKVNESRSLHIMFILRKGHWPADDIKQTLIPQTEVIKYLETTLRLQVKLERTHRQKRKQIDLKTKEINWLIGKQITHVQSGNHTDMELWNRTVGLRQQFQHSHHAEITIQNSQSHNKCTPVCNKSYAPRRLQHRLRK